MKLPTGSSGVSATTKGAANEVCIVFSFGTDRDATELWGNFSHYNAEICSLYLFDYRVEAIQVRICDAELLKIFIVIHAS